MPISTRPALSSDLPVIADIAALCFGKNDELYDYTNPWKLLYPLDFRDSLLLRLKMRFHAPGFFLNVAVWEEDDPAKGEEKGNPSQGVVVGYGLWERVGNDAAAQEYRNKGIRSCASHTSFILHLLSFHIPT